MSYNVFLILLLPALILIVFYSIQLLCLAWMFSSRKNGELRWLINEPEPNLELDDFPKVSVLLAARNEEKLILRSLEAMHQFDYPEDKLEILIGNDDSSDNTRSLVEDFIKDKPKFKLYDIHETLGKGRGKANVLAQLAHKADGEIYCITDVDVKLPPTWVKRLVSEFKPGVALVSGTTMCERGGLFATLQSIDWLHFMGYIKAFAKAGVGCTSVGNNMAVRAEAYWETGGYENIDFSITEDYKLFKEVTSRGWEWRTILDEHSLGKAWYIPEVKNMLHQRKRWLIGARELPLNWKLMIILYGLFLPAIAVIALFYFELALRLWFIKAMIQTLFINVLCLKAGEKPFRFLTLIAYEFYVILNTLATAIFYFLPIPSIWKGRVYNAEYIK